MGRRHDSSDDEYERKKKKKKDRHDDSDSDDRRDRRRKKSSKRHDSDCARQATERLHSSVLSRSYAPVFWSAAEFTCIDDLRRRVDTS